MLRDAADLLDQGKPSTDRRAHFSDSSDYDVESNELDDYHNYMVQNEESFDRISALEDYKA